MEGSPENYRWTTNLRRRSDYKPKIARMLSTADPTYSGQNQEATWQ